MSSSSVQRESVLLAEGLRRQGFRVYLERPTTAKWDESMFRSVTKYTGKVSQHAIDSAKLVSGVSSWIDRMQ